MYTFLIGFEVSKINPTGVKTVKQQCGRRAVEIFVMCGENRGGGRDCFNRDFDATSVALFFEEYADSLPAFGGPHGRNARFLRFKVQVGT